MASNLEFVEYLIEQISGVGEIRHRKMFGEYMIYVNEKPILLICDNTVFVKKLECVKDLISKPEVGHPYNGAKEHYILDPDNTDELREVAVVLEKVIPIPKKKKKVTS